MSYERDSATARARPVELMHQLSAERKTGLPYPTLERIAGYLAPIVAWYHVAKLFGETDKQHEMGLALGGALCALRGVFDDRSFADLCGGIGVDQLEAAELAEAIATLLPKHEEV